LVFEFSAWYVKKSVLFDLKKDKIIEKKKVFCGKYNGDYAECFKSALNFLVASVNFDKCFNVHLHMLTEVI